MAGDAEVGLNEHASGAIAGSAQFLAQRRGRDSCGPQNYGRDDTSVADVHHAGFNQSDHRVRADVDAQVAQLLFGAARQVFGIGGQHARAAFEQDDVGARRVNGAEFMRQNVTRDFRQYSGEFHAGGASAHDDEVQRLIAGAGKSPPFGQFKRKQHAAADFERVFDGLQARSEGLPIIVTEVGVRGAGGDHQVVVGKLLLRCLYDAAGEVEVLDFLKQGDDIGVAAEDCPDRSGDFAGGEASGGDLVEQWLEGVVIFAVDDGDLNRGAGQRATDIQAAKAGANDHDARCFLAGHEHLLIRLRECPLGRKVLHQIRPSRQPRLMRGLR